MSASLRDSGEQPATVEQEVGRAECIEAIGDDYANGAVGRVATCAMKYYATRRVRPPNFKQR